MPDVELLQLALPEIAFGGSYGLSKDQKGSYDLNEIRQAGFADLPDPLKIVGFRSFRQSPMSDIPPTLQGDCGWQVDPRGVYTKSANYPGDGTVELALPYTSEFLGGGILSPGQPRVPDPIWFKDPIYYRRSRGDRLIVFAEAENEPISIPVHVFGYLMVESDFGDFPLDPNNVYMLPCNVRQPSWGAAHGRVVIPNVTPPIATAPDFLQWRFHFSGMQKGSSVLKASAGIQGSGANMTTIPAPITFAGSPGFANATIAGMWTDWSSPPATPAPGSSILVDISFNGPGSLRQSGLSYYSNIDSYGTASMTVQGSQANIYFIDCAQFRVVSP